MAPGFSETLRVVRRAELRGANVSERQASASRLDSNNNNNNHNSNNNRNVVERQQFASAPLLRQMAVAAARCEEFRQNCKAACPGWVAMLCRRREALHLSALRLRRRESSDFIYLLFCWAYTGTLELSSYKLEYCPLDCTSVFWDDLPDDFFLHSFTIDTRSHVHSQFVSDLATIQEGDVDILHFCRHLGEYRLGSNALWIPLQEFVAQNAVSGKDAAPKSRARPRIAVASTDLPVEQFPWLQQFVSAPAESKPASSRPAPSESSRPAPSASDRPAASSEEPEARPKPLDPDALFTRLFELRETWKEQQRDAAQFFVAPRSWADSLCGWPLGNSEGEVGQWLRAMHLPGQCGNSMKQYGGDRHAGNLCRLWVWRMQHLWDKAHGLVPVVHFTSTVWNDFELPDDLVSWIAEARSQPKLSKRIDYIMNLLPR